jgi:competence protein ComEA
LNDAMPHWRTFSSSAAGEAADGGPGGAEAAATTARVAPGMTALLMAALGGASGGAALAIAAATLLGSMGGAGQGVGIGTAPADLTLGLDGLTVAAGEGPPSGVSPLGGGDAEAIVVDVGGAVARPGLHRLRAGARVGDAIEAAGGYAPRVDLAESGRTLNLAEPLSDGGKVVVPELGVDRPSASRIDDGRIDLNSADQAALETLPGIGPVTAGKIIEARSQERFGSVAELLARGVVGEAVFGDIQDLVRASG